MPTAAQGSLREPAATAAASELRGAPLGGGRPAAAPDGAPGSYPRGSPLGRRAETLGSRPDAAATITQLVPGGAASGVHASGDACEGERQRGRLDAPVPHESCESVLCR
eukprot:4131406-Prymnesium_polylepis.1